MYDNDNANCSGNIKRNSLNTCASANSNANGSDKGSATVNAGAIW